MLSRWDKTGQTSSLCLLCGREDGGHHVISGCKALSQTVTLRHNDAGTVIVKAIRRGSRGGELVASDIGIHKSRFRSKVVYAFVHLSEDRGHKRYVGSVHGCGVAGNRCAQGSGPGVEYVEQQWIDRYWSLHWGYNTRMAHSDPPVPFDTLNNSHCVGRLFGSRVWPARIHAIFCAYDRRPGLFSDNAYLHYFSRYSTATLVSLHTAVTMTPADIARTVHGAGVHAEWVSDLLCPWLCHLLNVRFARLVVGYQSKYAPYSLHAAYSPVLEHLNVAAAMCQAVALAKLPASLHESLPRKFTFKLPKPMGLFVCNHGPVAHTAAAENAACNCVCGRPEFRAFQHPMFPGHVLTTDSAVLHDCPAEMRTAWQHGFKFRQASQLEVHMTDVARTDLLSQCDAAVTSMVTHLRNKYRSCADFVASQHDFTAFGQMVSQHMHQQLGQGQFANGRVFSFLSSHSHDASVMVSPVSLDALRRHIRRYQHHFVITRMDKLPNVYVLMCKQLYRAQTVDDLQNSGYYNPNGSVAQAHAAITAAVTSPQFAVARFAYADESSMLCQLQNFPYASLLVKMHKNPVKMRFLACNGRNGLIPVAKIVTQLFRAVSPLLDTIWCTTLSTMGRTWANDGPWMCHNSEGIVKTLRRFNLSCMRYDTYVHGHGWRAWDVVRLFTNIDQADLLSRIRQLLKRAWIQQLPALNASRQGQGTMASQQTAVLQVFANKSVPVWHTSIDHAYLVYGRPEQAGIFSRGRMNNDRAGFDSCCGGFHLMTLAEAQTMSGLLIQQAYVRFEDTVYHQTTGIPMGINPAVYYANLYLVSYELDFLEQFLPLLRIGRNIPAVPVYPGPMVDVVDRMVSCITAADLLAADLPGTPYLRFAASQLLDQFRWIKRYADDITVGPNRFIESLLYTDHGCWAAGYTGCTPACTLHWKGRTAPFTSAWHWICAF
ncbi:hypothetical protein COO60DRAFT_1530222 [Scenedesmus sp. NREL 46B-D3]|nr:hypothetical protein COO60DRAFT_1530222 [Scenedesmus sp. NREL 46B-D3]